MDNNACPPNTGWYVCHDGFQGCCSVDPCGLNQCPDQNSNDTSIPVQSGVDTDTMSAMAEVAPKTAAETVPETAPTSTRSKTTFLVWSSPQPEATQTTESTTETKAPETTTLSTQSRAWWTRETYTGTISSASSSSVSTSTSSITTTTASQTIESQPTSEPTSGTIAAAERDHSNANKIGGIVGGCIGLLLILCLIAYLLCRLRKKRGRRGFTLLLWRHPRMDHDPTAKEEENIATAEVQMQDRSSSAAVGAMSGPANGQMRSIPEEQSPRVSPLHGQDEPPRTILAASSSPEISPQSGNPTLDPSSNVELIPLLPPAIHPALRPDQPAQPTTRYPNPIMIPKRNSTRRGYPRTRIPLSPRELFDTGFRLGRLELPAFSTRELINIPFAERQRSKQQKHLRRTTKFHLPIVTRDGALLSSNINTLPGSPDPHAISFGDHSLSPTSPSVERKTSPTSPSAERKQSPTSPSPSATSSLPPLSPPPPSYRSSWRSASSEVKEKLRDKLQRKS